MHPGVRPACALVLFVNGAPIEGRALRLVFDLPVIVVFFVVEEHSSLLPTREGVAVSWPAEEFEGNFGLFERRCPLGQERALSLFRLGFADPSPTRRVSSRPS